MAMAAKRMKEQAKLADELGTLIGRARRLVYYAAERRLERHGESMFTYLLLKHAVQRGGASQTKLAQLTAQHAAAVSRAIDELESRGLVERARDADDRRRVRVEATAEGRALFRAMHPEVVGGVDGALGRLDASERLALRALLDKLVGDGEPTHRD